MSRAPREPGGLVLEEQPGAIEFAVKVVPGASRTRVVGLHGDALKVSVAAPAEGGKANAALVTVLARWLEVRRADVAIVAGGSNPHKRVRVLHATRARLEAALGGSARPRRSESTGE